jgi:hypothetical protein
MRKLSPAKATVEKPTLPLSQPERLACKETLHGELARLDAMMRAVQDELATLLNCCEHTDADGRSAILGGRTKVCAHCGRVVTGRGEKLWQ